MNFQIVQVRMSVAIAIFSFLLAACGSMSGLDGKAEYGCRAPLGVHCDSVSGNYYNAIQNNLPAQRESISTSRALSPASASQPASYGWGEGKAGSDIASPNFAPSPLRSEARVLRLWFKPWEDADHDLYDQGFVYVQIDNGNWLIDHAQQRIRDAYAPIRPPRAKVASPAEKPDTPAIPTNFGSSPSENNANLPVTPSGISKLLPGASDQSARDSQ